MKCKGRYWMTSLTFILLIGGLTWRVLSLHIFEYDFLRRQGEVRTVRVVATPPYRGMITDRNGEPLAISTPVDSVWINPKEFDPEHPNVLALAAELDLSLNQVLEKVTQNKNRDFVYLQRHIRPESSQHLKSLAVPGIHLKSEYRRFYPAAEVTAQILGFTDIDDQGQEGLELAFNHWLAGEGGAKRIIRDRRNREVQILEGIKEMRSGQDLVLSIDQRLQYLAYRELKSVVNSSNAIGGTAVVLDVLTGEVLAMVNQPSFNPNTRVKLKSDERIRNRAVTDVFEPGSVLKTFSVVSALQYGRYSPTSLVDTAPGWMNIGKNTVREDNNKNFGVIDIATILQKSSNIGVTKLTLSLPPERLLQTYNSLGFGSTTGSGFPGESAGQLVTPPKHASFVLATLAFGYGMNVTALQLAEAYAVLGAEGVKRPVSFIKHTESVAAGERVIEPAIARQVVDMLAGVVQHGSGAKAQVVGYQTAGKTGTARKVAATGGYLKDSHIAVFAGLAPASNPRFAIVVMVDDPKVSGEYGYYGSVLAAPVFSKIAAGALRLFNVPPDQVDPQKLRVATSTGSH